MSKKKRNQNKKKPIKKIDPVVITERRRDPYIYAAAFSALTLIIFYKPLLTRSTIFFADFTYIFYPFHHTLAAALKNGTLPLWNPYNALGYSMVGDPQSHVLYPPAWVLAVVPFSRGYMWFIFMHYAAAGVGMMLLLRKLGRSGPAALFGSLAFAFCGLLVSIHIFGHIFSITWMPYVLWSLLRLRDKPTASAAGAAALFIVLQITAGEIQIVYFTALLIAAYILICDGREVFSARGPRRYLPVAGAAALAAAAAAPFLLCVARSMLNTQRFGLSDFEFATQWSVNPITTYAMFAVNPFGLYDIDKYYWQDILMVRGEQQAAAASIYMGVSALAMALLAIKRRPRETAFFSVSALIFLVLAFGSFTPLFKPLFYYFPLMKVFNYPYKFLAFFQFAAAILAAYGFDEFLRDACAFKLKRGLFIGVGATLAVLIVAGHVVCASVLNSVAASMPPWKPDIISSHLNMTLLSALCLSASFVAFLYLVSRKPRAWLVLPAFLAVELILGGIRTVWTIPESEFNETPAVARMIKEQDNSPEYEYRVNFAGSENLLTNLSGEGFEGLVRVNRRKRAFLQPNFNQVTGMHSPWFYISYLPADYKEKLDIFYYYDAAAADLFNVRYISTPAPTSFQRTPSSLPFPDIGRDPETDIHVYRNPNPFPRAYWSGNPILVADRKQAKKAVYKNLDTLLARPVIETETGFVPAPSAAGNASITKYGFNEVSVASDAPAEGFLVLLDGYDKGWAAAVDGAPAPLLRANMFFRAVKLSAGRHSVDFVYRPRELTAGLIISATAICIWALFLIVEAAVLRKRKVAN